MAKEGRLVVAAGITLIAACVFVPVSVQAKSVLYEVELEDGGKSIYYDDGSYEIKLNQDGEVIDYKADKTSDGYNIESTIQGDDGDVVNYSATTNDSTGVINSKVKIENSDQTIHTTSTVQNGSAGTVEAQINGRTYKYSLKDIDSGKVEVKAGGVINLAANGEVTISTDQGVTLSAQYNNGGIAGKTKNYIINLEGDSVYLIAGPSDLAAYSQIVVEQRPNVKKVEVNGSTVEVTYKQPARLFGFIPTAITGTVEVDSAGSVDIQLPWYSFLYKKDTQPIKQSVAGTLASAMISGIDPRDLANESEAVASRTAAKIINYTSFVTDKVTGAGNQVVDAVVNKEGRVEINTVEGSLVDTVKVLPDGSEVDIDAVVNGNTFKVDGTKNKDGSITVKQVINGNDINFIAVPNANGTYDVTADYNGYREYYNSVRLGN